MPHSNILKHTLHGELAPESVKIAVTILLWEMANVDRDMNGKEHEYILHRLNQSFGFPEGEAAELLDLVLTLEAVAKHLDTHLGEINRNYSSTQKEFIFQILLELASADGELETAESELALVFREKLNLALTTLP